RMVAAVEGKEVEGVLLPLEEVAEKDLGIMLKRPDKKAERALLFSMKKLQLEAEEDAVAALPLVVALLFMQVRLSPFLSFSLIVLPLLLLLPSPLSSPLSSTLSSPLSPAVFFRSFFPAFPNKTLYLLSLMASLSVPPIRLCPPFETSQRFSATTSIFKAPQKQSPHGLSASATTPHPFLPLFVSPTPTQAHNKALQAPGCALSAVITHLKSSLSPTDFSSLSALHSAVVAAIGKRTAGGRGQAGEGEGGEGGEKGVDMEALLKGLKEVALGKAKEGKGGSDE
ncbi:unnamed protein product, partial [Closterium sp. Naga37s-1]